MLADWIWQGCKYMKNELSVCVDEGIACYLKSSIINALTIHYKLFLCSDEEIQEHINNFFIRTDKTE